MPFCGMRNPDSPTASTEESIGLLLQSLAVLLKALAASGVPWCTYTGMLEHCCAPSTKDHATATHTATVIQQLVSGVRASDTPTDECLEPCLWMCLYSVHNHLPMSHRTFWLFVAPAACSAEPWQPMQRKLVCWRRCWQLQPPTRAQRPWVRRPAAC